MTTLLQRPLFALSACAAIAGALGSQGRWQEIHAFESRAGATMAYDATAERVILFGGLFAGVEFPNNTWEWDKTAWRCRQSLARPRGRSGAGFAYSPSQRGLLLYGGYTLDPQSPIAFAGKRFVNDTWLWDGRRWTQLKPKVSPKPDRDATSMAYDVGRKKMLLFGGSISLMVINPLDETWEFDGTTWTQLFPTHKPEKRAAATMAYHPVTGRLMLFGGQGSAGFFGDTWEWDGADWKKVAGQVQGLEARSGATLLTIPWKNTVYLVGGYQATLPTNTWPLTPRADIWEWTGTTWKLVPNSTAPFPEMSNGAVADPTTQRILVTGGAYDAKVPHRQRETWSWDGKTWTREDEGSAQESNYASYALDPVRDQILALVAPEPRQPSKHPLETWVLPTGGQWTRLQPKHSPPGYAHTSAAERPRMVWHQALGLMVMCLKTTNGYETWHWDGSDWKSSPSQSYPQSVQICYDSRRKKVLALEYDAQIGKHNMWAWDSKGWVLTHSQIPGPYLSLGVDGWAYDPARDRIVACYSPGVTGTKFLTVEWDGKAWKSIGQACGKVDNAQLFYHPGLGGVVACGGLDLASTSPILPNTDSWLWDGKTWTRLVGPKLPAQRNMAMMQAFYDPGRQRGIAVFPGPVPSQLWEFRLDSLRASQPYPHPGEPFTMDVQMPAQAGNPFLLMFAGTTRPGIPLRQVPGVGTELLPLTPDPLFWLSLQLGLVAGLDLKGQASLPLRFPNDSNLLWLDLHMAGVTFDKSGIAALSDQVPLRIVK